MGAIGDGKAALKGESHPLECEESEGTCISPVPLSRIRTFLLAGRSCALGLVRGGTWGYRDPPERNKLREEPKSMALSCTLAVLTPTTVIPAVFHKKGEARDLGTHERLLRVGD